MKSELTGGAGGNTMIAAEYPRTASTSSSHRSNLGAFLHSEPTLTFSFNDVFHQDETNTFQRQSNASSSNSPRSYYGYQLDATPTMSLSSTEGSPYVLSPLNYQPSPYSKSPWILPSPNYLNNPYDRSTLSSQNGLIGSLVRKEGHIYSLAVSGDLLYTGSDSKNIRIWKNLKEYAGFKSNSGLVKAIVVLGEKIFTGHQDGKIRVWKVSSNNQRINKRVGSLPTFKDYVKSSVNPKNYVEARRNKNVLRIRHFDAISSLSLDEEQGLLYSGSWDKTVKVWRVSDSKFLESINAHDDAVNSVVVGFRCFVFSGSADGTIKTWRREYDKKGRTKHVLEQVLLMQENAVTALAVNRSSTVIYGGSSDGLVNFWEREGKNNGLSHGGVLRGHKLAILCLAAAENLFFSGSADKNICVWRRDNETGTHACLTVLIGHSEPVKCIAVEEEAEDELLRGAEQYGDEDGDYEEGDRNDHLLHYDGHGYRSNNSLKGGDPRWIVYSGSLDKSVKVWRVTDYDTTMMKGLDHIGLESDLHASIDSSTGGRFSISSPLRVTAQGKRHFCYN